MIVLLAILNDIPIVVIAWNNARTPDKPVRWDMKRVLSMATPLSLAGVVSLFPFFYYLREFTAFSEYIVQTIFFLKLLIAGHMKIFLTRKPNSLWDKPFPGLKLFIPLEITQII
jgi:H+-transporting ATPase